MELIFLCPRLSKDIYPSMEVSGKPLIERIVNLFDSVTDKHYTFVINSEQDKIFPNLFGGGKIVLLPGETQGSACSALYAAVQLPKDSPLWIISANEISELNYEKISNYFLQSTADAGVLVFQSKSDKYSYIKLDNNKEIIQLEQNKQLSNFATTGCFWFRTCETFVNAVEKMIKKRDLHNNKYFIAPSLNQIILDDGKVAYFEIDRNQYHPAKDILDLITIGNKMK